VEQVRAGLENRAPSPNPAQAAPFQVRAHNQYLGDPNLRAIEFYPRFGESITAIAYPSNGPTPIRVGVGPADGGGVGNILEHSLDGTVELDKIPMAFTGAGNALTPATSAYIVFQGQFAY